MKSRWGKDTDQKISARSSTLLIFAVGWALCGQPQPDHEWGEHCVVNHNPNTSGVSIVWSTTTRPRVSDDTAITSYVKMF